MTWLLYVGLVLLVVTCTALVPWMKREGEREWRRHRRAMARAQMAASAERFRAAMLSLADEMANWTPALSKMSDRLDSLTYALFGLNRRDKDA